MLWKQVRYPHDSQKGQKNGTVRRPVQESPRILAIGDIDQEIEGLIFGLERPFEEIVVICRHDKLMIRRTIIAP